MQRRPALGLVRLEVGAAGSAFDEGEGVLPTAPEDEEEDALIPLGAGTGNGLPGGWGCGRPEREPKRGIHEPRGCFENFEH